jgi:hypothetical protein
LYLSGRDSDNLGVDRLQGVFKARIWERPTWNIHQKMTEKIPEKIDLKNTGKHKAAGLLGSTPIIGQGLSFADQRGRSHDRVGHTDESRIQIRGALWIAGKQ